MHGQSVMGIGIFVRAFSKLAEYVKFEWKSAQTICCQAVVVEVLISFNLLSIFWQVLQDILLRGTIE